MKNDSPFEPARPNIFPSQLGLEIRKHSLRDWPFYIFSLLPALALREGGELFRQVWQTVKRRL